MIPTRRVAVRRGWLPLLGAVAMLVALLLPSGTARAHPLDIFLQASYLTVGTGQIVVELDLTPGVLVAPAALTEIDSDGNAQISDAEAQAYAEGVLSSVTLQVDGQPVSLAVTSVDMPDYLNIQAGYGTIRIFTSGTLPEGMSGAHEIAYENGYAPTGSAYQVNTFIAKDAALTLGTQNRDSIQQRMTMEYAIGGSAPATDGLTGTTPGTAAQAQRLLGYLDTPSLSPWQMLLALGLAVMLGGLHALTPGHGKTLVAAYLVGSRGTVRHAAALGAIVTFTHTASVIAIGLAALFASQFIMPDVLVPAMEVLSGALVVVMGARLIRQRWGMFRSSRSAAQVHTHDHDHAHEHSHDHSDGHVHTHLPPEGFTIGGLVAMGVTGGLVPCPEALGIMIIAVGLNRIALGLGLIVSFSFGLAAVLIALGVLLVRSRSLVERAGGFGSRLTVGLPLGSAVLVTLLGIGITFGGLSSYLH